MVADAQRSASLLPEPSRRVEALLLPVPQEPATCKSLPFGGSDYALFDTRGRSMPPCCFRPCRANTPVSVEVRLCCNGLRPLPRSNRFRPSIRRTCLGFPRASRSDLRLQMFAMPRPLGRFRSSCQRRETVRRGQNAIVILAATKIVTHSTLSAGVIGWAWASEERSSS